MEEKKIEFGIDSIVQNILSDYDGEKNIDAFNLKSKEIL